MRKSERLELKDWRMADEWTFTKGVLLPAQVLVGEAELGSHVVQNLNKSDWKEVLPKTGRHAHSTRLCIDIGSNASFSLWDSAGKPVNQNDEGKYQTHNKRSGVNDVEFKIERRPVPAKASCDGLLEHNPNDKTARILIDWTRTEKSKEHREHVG